MLRWLLAAGCWLLAALLAACSAGCWLLAAARKGCAGAVVVGVWPSECAAYRPLTWLLSPALSHSLPLSPTSLPASSSPRCAVCRSHQIYRSDFRKIVSRKQHYIITSSDARFLAPATHKLRLLPHSQTLAPQPRGAFVRRSTQPLFCRDCQKQFFSFCSLGVLPLTGGPHG